MIKKGVLQVVAEDSKEILVNLKLECDSNFINKQDMQKILKMLEEKSGNTVKTVKSIFEQLLQVQEQIIENENYGIFNTSFSFGDDASDMEEEFGMFTFLLKFIDKNIDEFCNDKQNIRFKTVNHYGFTEEKIDNIIDMINTYNYDFSKIKNEVTNLAFTNSGFICDGGNISKLLKSEFEKYISILLYQLNNLDIDIIKNGSDSYSKYNYDETSKELVISIKDSIVFTIDKNIETNDVNICILFKDEDMDIYPGVALVIEGTVTKK